MSVERIEIPATASKTLESTLLQNEGRRRGSWFTRLWGLERETEGDRKKGNWVFIHGGVWGYLTLKRKLGLGLIKSKT